jgi:hypothetical protein
MSYRYPIAALLLTAALATTRARAQGYAEGIALSYEAMPLRQQVPATAAALTHSLHFRADVYRASLVVPLALGADSSRSLLLGSSLEALHLSGSRALPATTVYGLNPIIGYRWRSSPRLELAALFLPMLNSDLQAVRGKDVTYGGVLRAVWQRNPRLAWRATVGYRQQFYGPQYVLLLGLDWHPAPHWRIFGDLPSSFTIGYAAGPRWNLGYSFVGSNTAYRLATADHYLHYKPGHHGLFAETYLTPHWALRATVAYSLTRRLAVYERADTWPVTIDFVGLGAAPAPLTPAVEKNLTFRIGLSYRVPTP